MNEEFVNINIDANAESLQIPRDVYLRILEKAIIQTETDILELEKSLTAEDYEVVQQISHRLKGDYDNMRISSLSMTAKEINQIVKGTPDREKLQELMKIFINNFTRLKLHLKES